MDYHSRYCGPDGYAGHICCFQAAFFLIFLGGLIRINPEKCTGSFFLIFLGINQRINTYEPVRAVCTHPMTGTAIQNGRQHDDAARARRSRRKKRMVIIASYVYASMMARGHRTRALGGSLWHQLYSRKDDAELLRSHRVNWRIFDWIIDRIQHCIVPKDGRGRVAVSPREKLGIFLHRLSHGSTYEELADIYAKSPSCVHKVITSTTRAVMVELGGMVRWPTRSEAVEMGHYLYNVTGERLPRAVGAIDGTQVYCRAPSIPLQQAYYNYKRGMSINVHLVVDGR